MKFWNHLSWYTIFVLVFYDRHLELELVDGRCRVDM